MLLILGRRRGEGRAEKKKKMSRRSATTNFLSAGAFSELHLKENEANRIKIVLGTGLHSAVPSLAHCSDCEDGAIGGRWEG